MLYVLNSEYAEQQNTEISSLNTYHYSKRNALAKIKQGCRAGKNMQRSTKSQEVSRQNRLCSRYKKITARLRANCLANSARNMTMKLISKPNEFDVEIKTWSLILEFECLYTVWTTENLNINLSLNFNLTLNFNFEIWIWAWIWTLNLSLISNLNSNLNLNLNLKLNFSSS